MNFRRGMNIVNGGSLAISSMGVDQMGLGGSWAGLEMQVLAPVMDRARSATGRVAGALTDVWHGFHGSPTMPNGTNWNWYSHEQLQGMLHQG